MSAELIPIDIESSAELLRLVEQVERTQAAYALVRAGETVAILTPVPHQTAPTRHSRKQRIQPEVVLNIVGMGASAEPGDIGRFKDQYLADAIDRRNR